MTLGGLHDLAQGHGFMVECGPGRNLAGRDKKLCLWTGLELLIDEVMQKEILVNIMRPIQNK